MNLNTSTVNAIVTRSRTAARARAPRLRDKRGEKARTYDGRARRPPAAWAWLVPRRRGRAAPPRGRAGCRRGRRGRGEYRELSDLHNGPSYHRRYVRRVPRWKLRNRSERVNLQRTRTPNGAPGVLGFEPTQEYHHVS